MIGMFKTCQRYFLWYGKMPRLFMNAQGAACSHSDVDDCCFSYLYMMVYEQFFYSFALTRKKSGNYTLIQDISTSHSCSLSFDALPVHGGKHHS